MCSLLFARSSHLEAFILDADGDSNATVPQNIQCVLPGLTVRVVGEARDFEAEPEELDHRCLSRTSRADKDGESWIELEAEAVEEPALHLDSLDEQLAPVLVSRSGARLHSRSRGSPPSRRRLSLSNRLGTSSCRAG